MLDGKLKKPTLKGLQFLTQFCAELALTEKSFVQVVCCTTYSLMHRCLFTILLQPEFYGEVLKALVMEGCTDDAQRLLDMRVTGKVRRLFLRMAAGRES